MAQTLHQRQSEYESESDRKIMAQVPLVVLLDGRSFSNVTRNIPKPFCTKTMSVFGNTLLSLCQEVEQVVFGYQYSDKILLILKPDPEPWFSGRVQKLSSISASLATYFFLNHLWEMGDNAPDLQGNIVFSGHTFGLPHVHEVINHLVYRQLRCRHYALNATTYSVLRTRYGSETDAMLEGKSTEDRKRILLEEGIDFNDLPPAFLYGMGAYLTPSAIMTEHGQKTRHKWKLDLELSDFVECKDFLRTIITTGSDIFRPERDLHDDSVQ